MKIAVAANSAWYLANFRLRLMRCLADDGHDVVGVSPPGHDVARITAAGLRHAAVPLSASGVNPLREARSVLALRRLLWHESVDVVLSYTPKMNIYTALARTALRCAQIANVSGLGSSFIRQDWLTSVVSSLYRLSFRSIDHVFFQNDDDRQLFLSAGIVGADRTERIPGSGVDLNRFSPAPLPSGADTDIVFLMIARLIEDKGVREFVSAARKVKDQVPGARFCLLGSAAADNPTAVPAECLERWQSEGLIQYLGSVEDVRPCIAAAHCVVLPSYREGMPRTLLEAGAMARPLIATDVPGCREVVDDGVNGFLCKPRDAESLADAMLRMAGRTHEQRLRMGSASRAKMEQAYSEDIVLSRYRAALEALAGRYQPART